MEACDLEIELGDGATERVCEVRGKQTLIPRHKFTAMNARAQGFDWVLQGYLKDVFKRSPNQQSW